MDNLNTANTPVRPWVTSMADLMDTRFRLPGTSFRFGLDPIIGLVPVLGDTVTAAIGAGMIGEARRLGLGLDVQARIVGNLAVDWLVGLIPGLDLVLDSAVKAHTRNALLIIEHAHEQSTVVRTVTFEAPEPSVIAAPTQ